MPLVRCESEGKVGWKWGESGHCYFGKDAKKKAMKQAAAIEANRQSDGISTRALPLSVGEIADGQREFRATLGTENPVLMPDWKRMEMVPEVLLMSGARMPSDGVLPLLNSHQRSDALQQLGSARGVAVDGGSMTGSLTFADTGSGNEARKLVEQKHARSVSLGYRVSKRQFVESGKTQTIAGRSFSGPVNVATDWVPLEVSMVPLGADAAAKLRGYAENPFESEEDFTMNPELRAALVTRGMSNDLDDEAAQKWLVENFAKLESRMLHPLEYVPPRPEQRSEPPVAASGTEQGDSSQVIALSVRRFMEERETNIRAITDECDQHKLTGDEIEMVLRGSGADLAAARGLILKALADRQKKEQPIGRTLEFSHLDGGTAQREKHTAALQTAILTRAFQNAGTSQRQVDALLPAANRAVGWEQFRHMRLLDIAKESLEMRGISTRGLDPVSVAQLAMNREDIQAAGRYNILSRAAPSMHNTGSFPSLMLDAVNKTLLAAYTETASTWQTVFRTAASVPDFKQIHRIRMGEVPNLQGWPDDTVPAQVRMSDAKESYAVEARALGTSFSYQSLINDDLDAFSRVPAMLGNAARRTVNASVWNVVTSNPNLQDGVALFATATGNRKKDNYVASGSGAPTVARIGVGTKLMRLQVGLNTPENNASDAILNLQPRFLVVPAALEVTTLQLVNSSFDPVANTFQVFNPARTLTPVVEPLLDANSTTAWYLFADTGQIDTIEVTFLQGQETPITHTWMDDETHGMKIDIIQTWGVKAIDFRGCFKDIGTA